jgi:cytochrome c5
MKQVRRLPIRMAALLLAIACTARAQSPTPIQQTLPQTLSDRQESLLIANCTQCHSRPGVGAPLIGDDAAWKERRALGEDRMLEHVVLGQRGMPPLGYCSACSEQDLRDLIRYMAGAR